MWYQTQRASFVTSFTLRLFCTVGRRITPENVCKEGIKLFRK
jgi:hypothetical protein